MKIGVPKIRLSRKLVFITLGITVLLGGSGVAALYVGGADLLGEPQRNAAGGVCTDVQTMVLKTPSNHLRLRKYIRMENADGPERVRTALRIAGLLAQKNTVDLIHVSVLDVHGPNKRAGMRGRAIGAEVLIALKPGNLPEMKTPAMASYYEGPVSDEGRFYGDKVSIDFEEVREMMTAMRSVEDKADCEKPEGAEEPAAAKKPDHGKKDKKASADHGEKPANDDGGHAKAEDPSAEPAKEQSFLDSILSMVGLGGGEAKPAEAADEQAKAEGGEEKPGAEDLSHAVAEEPAEPATENSKAAEDHAPPAEADPEATEHAPAKTTDADEKKASAEHSAPETTEAAAH